MICGRATVPGLLFLLPVGDSWFWLMSTGTCKLYSYDKLPGFSGCCYCFVATITEKNPCKRCTFLLKIWVQNWGWRLSMAWCNKHVISTTVLNILKVYLFVSNWCLPTELELVLYLGFKLGGAAYLCSYGLFVGFMANISKISKDIPQFVMKNPKISSLCWCYRFVQYGNWGCYMFTGHSHQICSSVWLSCWEAFWMGLSWSSSGMIQYCTRIHSMSVKMQGLNDCLAKTVKEILV